VDGSDNAEIAFTYCTSKLVKKEEDEVFIISVMEAAYVYPYGVGFVYKQDEVQHRKYLRHYCIRCRRMGIKHYTPVLGQGDHVGAIICNAVKKKNIHNVVVGRRGMSLFKRFLSGSNSKYVMENADCNVFIVKGNFIEEEHVPLGEVISLEEKERARRMKEAGYEAVATEREIRQEEREHGETLRKVIAAEEQERFRRIAEAAEEVNKRAQIMRSDLNLHITIMAEEEERLRRLREDKDHIEEGLAHRQAALVAAEFKKLELSHVSTEEEEDVNNRLLNILRVTREKDKQHHHHHRETSVTTTTTSTTVPTQEEK